MKKKTYYIKKWGDYRDLCTPGEKFIKVYPREDTILSVNYDSVKDQTTIKLEKGD